MNKNKHLKKCRTRKKGISVLKVKTEKLIIFKIKMIMLDKVDSRKKTPQIAMKLSPKKKKKDYLCFYLIL